MIQCKSKQHAASASLPNGNIYLFYKLLSVDGGGGMQNQGRRAGREDWAIMAALNACSHRAETEPCRVQWKLLASGRIVG